MAEQKRTWREAQREDAKARQKPDGVCHSTATIASSPPEQMAYAAYQRGDRIFQIDLPVAWV
jgi:hypothetical protein